VRSMASSSQESSLHDMSTELYSGQNWQNTVLTV
jgi:hypothetical protein